MIAKTLLSETLARISQTQSAPPQIEVRISAYRVTRPVINRARKWAVVYTPGWDHSGEASNNDPGRFFDFQLCLCDRVLIPSQNFLINYQTINCSNSVTHQSNEHRFPGSASVQGTSYAFPSLSRPGACTWSLTPASQYTTHIGPTSLAQKVITGKPIPNVTVIDTDVTLNAALETWRTIQVKTEETERPVGDRWKAFCDSIFESEEGHAENKLSLNLKAWVSQFKARQFSNFDAVHDLAHYTIWDDARPSLSSRERQRIFEQVLDQLAGEQSAFNGSLPSLSLHDRLNTLLGERLRTQTTVCTSERPRDYQVDAIPGVSVWIRCFAFWTGSPPPVGDLDTRVHAVFDTDRGLETEDDYRFSRRADGARLSHRGSSGSAGCDRPACCPRLRCYPRSRLSGRRQNRRPWSHCKTARSIANTIRRALGRSVVDHVRVGKW